MACKLLVTHKNSTLTVSLVSHVTWGAVLNSPLMWKWVKVQYSVSIVLSGWSLLHFNYIHTDENIRHKWIFRLSNMFCFRSMNTFAVNSAPCMKMTASLTSSSAAGMVVTGKCPCSLIGEPFTCYCPVVCFFYSIFYCTVFLNYRFDPSITGDIVFVISSHHQCHHDWLLQQLLPNVWPQHQAGHHTGGVPGEQQTTGYAQTTQGVHWWQEEEGWDQRGQPGLQQEDPPHCLAPQR